MRNTSNRFLLVVLAAAGSLHATSAQAGTITAQGTNCTAVTDYNDMGVLSGQAEFDEGPVSGGVPLNTYSALGMTFHTGALTAALAGVTTAGSASQPQYDTPGTYFPMPVEGNGIQNLNTNLFAGVATFDIVVTKFGLTASSNGNQYLSAWDDAGNLIGQVNWVPGGTSSFVGIDCGNVPIKMIAYGNDDLWNGGTYGIGGSTIFSDTWVWSGDTNCGNNVLDMGEECDDGNNDFTDACALGCKAATCGDKFVYDGVEACDDGNADNTDDCLDTCEMPTCGDGYVWDGNEVCDDGNMVETDGCLSTCQEPTCGDGIVWEGMEACDDGNDDNQDGCLDTCELSGCGDGFVEAGTEECDDGNLIPTDGCTDMCKFPVCGDGIIREFQEECDDGNMDNTDECAECSAAVCGDGHVWAGNEECDDANQTDFDACHNDCTLNDDVGTTGATSSGGTTTGASGSGTGGETGTGTGTGETNSGSTTDVEPTTTGFATSAGLDDPSLGCACSSQDDSSPAPMWLLPLLAGAGFRRRRRSAR